MLLGNFLKGWPPIKKVAALDRGYISYFLAYRLSEQGL
jgi:hypothetical protein